MGAVLAVNWPGHSTTMTGEYQSSPTPNQQYEDDDDGDDEVVTTATLERAGDVHVLCTDRELVLGRMVLMLTEITYTDSEVLQLVRRRQDGCSEGDTL